MSSTAFSEYTTDLSTVSSLHVGLAPREAFEEGSDDGVPPTGLNEAGDNLGEVLEESFKDNFGLVLGDALGDGGEVLDVVRERPRADISPELSSSLRSVSSSSNLSGFFFLGEEVPTGMLLDLFTRSE